MDETSTPSDLSRWQTLRDTFDVRPEAGDPCVTVLRGAYEVDETLMESADFQSRRQRIREILAGDSRVA